MFVWRCVSSDAKILMIFAGMLFFTVEVVVFISSRDLYTSSGPIWGKDPSGIGGKVRSEFSRGSYWFAIRSYCDNTSHAFISALRIEQSVYKRYT